MRQRSLVALCFRNNQRTDAQGLLFALKVAGCRSSCHSFCMSLQMRIRSRRSIPRHSRRSSCPALRLKMLLQLQQLLQNSHRKVHPISISPPRQLPLRFIVCTLLLSSVRQLILLSLPIEPLHHQTTLLQEGQRRRKRVHFSGTEQQLAEGDTMEIAKVVTDCRKHMPWWYDGSL